ncbi:cytochrome P450 [Candidatus Bathyarchaeota archaeon]|nr:cytochrome P450 [Candidatus Bathyarchaeota archaeon]
MSELSAVRSIHSVKAGYLKSPFYLKLTGRSIASVFSTTDVEYHRRHRRLLSMPLSESALKTVEPIVRSKASLAVQRISEEMNSRGAADVFKWFLFYSTDVIGELSFGQSFRMLEIGMVRSPLAYAMWERYLRVELPANASTAEKPIHY